MKSFINNISRMVMPALAVGAALICSCEDQPDKFEQTDGNPTVWYVRLSDAASGDSIITGANVGTEVCLVGENLTSIHELYFNDRKATLNTSLITDNTMIVSVPNRLPGVAYNKIFMVNCDKDTTEYDFQVYGIKPEISSMSAEFAAPGQEVTIEGNYFVDDPITPLKVTVGDTECELTSVSDESVSFIMPTSAKAGDRIAVTSTYGTTYAPFKYKDLTQSGMLFDNWGQEGEDGTGLTNHGWHNRVFYNDEWSVSGWYMQLGDGTTTMSADGGWNDSQFSFEYWPGDWNTPTGFTGTDKRLSDLFDKDNWQNLALKFEMCIPKSNPWMAGHMQVIFSSDAQCSCPNNNNTFFHSTDYVLPRAIYAPWETTGSFDTGDQWITVTLPLATAFCYQYWGATTSETLSADNLTGLTIFIVDFADANDTRTMKTGTDCTPIIKIDNVRVVEK